MKQQMQVFVFMEKRTKFDRQTYQCNEVWEPDMWTIRVDDTESRVFINEQTVEFDAPDKFDPVPGQVAALEAEKREAMASYQHRVASINERLSKLQAIEYAP